MPNFLGDAEDQSGHNNPITKAFAKKAEDGGAFGKGFNLFEGNFFGGNELIEPPEVSAARGELYNMAMNPQAPRRGVADFDPFEQLMTNYMKQFAQGEPNQNRQLAGEKAREFAEGSDPTQLPEFKAIMDLVQQAGDQNLRNAGRGLRTQGNDVLSSRKGAEAIDRRNADEQAKMVAAATPFLEAERGRQWAAVTFLDQLATMENNEKLQRIEVGDRAGAKLRGMKQQVLDESYNQQMANLEAKGNWLMSLLGTNPGGTMYQKGFSDRVQDVLNGGKTVQSTISGYFGTFGKGGSTGAS